ncbi:hypothetical protein [Roseobacter phage RDJL6]|nr:hypothetical protein [Roseobacter phage RDJL6]
MRHKPFLFQAWLSSFWVMALLVGVLAGQIILAIHDHNDGSLCEPEPAQCELTDPQP